MITLYTFGPAFGLPDPSPFVTKAETLIRMAGLRYRTNTEGFSKAPKRKLPYIDDEGKRIADSTFIRWHIEKKYGFDFDRGLSPEQRATAWAFEKMAEDNLYWTLVHAGGRVMRTSTRVRHSFFGKCRRQCVRSRWHSIRTAAERRDNLKHDCLICDLTTFGLIVNVCRGDRVRLIPLLVVVGPF
jgi:Glutathione S-transferase N-terminal domain